jgi:hypothetical protein
MQLTNDPVQFSIIADPTELFAREMKVREIRAKEIAMSVALS